MKYQLVSLMSLILLANVYLNGQENNWKKYEANAENSHGLQNPDAPEQLADFAPMIGDCDCKDTRRLPNGNWPDTSALTWTFKYIMNGTAIQDHTWRETGYASSVRQFHADSLVWIVNYNSYPSVSMAGTIWMGGKIDNDIVLKAKQKAPNGADGFSRLTFYNISEDGFDWKGEWVSEDETIVFPFWKIWCKKRQ